MSPRTFAHRGMQAAAILWLCAPLPLAFPCMATAQTMQPGDGSAEIAAFRERMAGDDQEDRLQAVSEALASQDELLRSLAFVTAIQSRNPRLREAALTHLASLKGGLEVQVQVEPSLADRIAASLLEQGPPQGRLGQVLAHPRLTLELAAPPQEGSFTGISPELGPFTGSVRGGHLDVFFGNEPGSLCGLELAGVEQGFLTGDLRCQGRVLPARIQLP